MGGSWMSGLRIWRGGLGRCGDGIFEAETCGLTVGPMKGLEAD